jgi:antitoxin component of MazEF toxin-antitoxin module
MGDVENFINAPIMGKTIQDINDGNTTALVIPKEFAKELKIENSKVSMSLIKDLDGNKHLLISKVYIEIVLD